MVINHHHIRALGIGGGNGGITERAAIDAQDQIVIRAQLFHRRHIGAIAFFDAVRHIQGRVAPEKMQPVQQQSRRSAAVNIVIRENRDGLVAVQRR